MEEKKEEVKPVEPVKETPKPAVAEEKKVETPKVEAEPESQEPQKIETVYQKLDGPKIVGEKIDLTQFAPKPGAGAKRKERELKSQAEVRITRARVETIKTLEIIKVDKVETVNTIMVEDKVETVRARADKETVHKVREVKVETVSGITRRSRRKPSGRPRWWLQKGGQNNRPGQRVMPVELTDEQVKNQIKETLEKLTNKGGKSKSAKHRKDKRTFRREQDERQQELEAQDRTLKVTEFITVGELASLMNVSPTEVISACFSLGVMVTMNQRLEADTLLLVADEFGYKLNSLMQILKIQMQKTKWILKKAWFQEPL